VPREIFREVISVLNNLRHVLNKNKILNWFTQIRYLGKNSCEEIDTRFYIMLF